jgi:2-polyprenyl-3-methyl-5-hydroxy-6-metoxy-1,4-benzoquinol methylase
MSDLYSNYARRVPHRRSQRFIRNWHDKLINRVLRLSPTATSWLEIGPGHGFVAEIVQERGLSYRYADNSHAIHEELAHKGYLGYLGLINQLTINERFDVVYLSHVLEHSPTWLDAREMLIACRELLNPGGCIAVVSPDILSWRNEFWNVDHTHGFPTSLRNVCQMLDDVGMTIVSATHHRNGRNGLLNRAIFSVLSHVPHGLIDRLLSPRRARVGDGPTYSWKAVFGWRQIFVHACKTDN